MKVFSTVYKWIGIAAGLISFATAVYALVSAGADMRERRRVVTEELATAHSQQTAGDYSAAWDNLAKARSTADSDGVMAKVLGGLSKERQTVRSAQEDLAMEWIRATHATEGHPFSEVAMKVTDVLATGASGSNGPRKADLLAHLGWSYFLRSREGDSSARPDVPYTEAVAADPTNPYANAFWGHWTLWTHGPLPDALHRFDVALGNGRAHAEVRSLELTALANLRTDDGDGAWLRVIDDMHKKGEVVDLQTQHELYEKYYFALNDEKLLKTLLAAVPASDQVELQRELLKSGGLEEYQRQGLTAVMAETLEAAGNPDDALATWRDLQMQLHGDPKSVLTARVAGEIKRLSQPAKPAKPTIAATPAKARGA